MKPHSNRPRIGLLAMSLEFYEQLAPGLRQSRENWLRSAVLPALATFAEIRFCRAVCRREEVDAIVREYEATGLDALLVVFLTYAPSQIALPALRRTHLPVVIWNTQELWAVDADFDMDKMLHSHGVHGTQDLANVLVRSGTAFHYVTSHLHDDHPLQELFDYFQAAAAATALRSCRVGLMGYPFPGMGDIAVDCTQLAETLGCRCVPLSVAEYNQRAAAAPADAVKRIKAEYRRSYKLAEDLQDDDLDGTARAELSLRSIVADERLDAFSFQFLALGDDPRTETLPFVAASRMMAEGVGFAGEGDVIGATGTWFLNRLCPPASFTEIFTIDFSGNSLLLSHMGEANVAMARTDGPVLLAARPQPLTHTLGRQLALITSFEPGPATLCAMTLGPCGHWRLIASPVEIGDFGPLLGLPVPHCKIRNCGDVRDWLTNYARAGGPHHHALCFGDARLRLKLAASLIGAEYCEV
jgi:L-arabinose isomerase